jgi:hypothetical protein
VEASSHGLHSTKKLGEKLKSQQVFDTYVIRNTVVKFRKWRFPNIKKYGDSIE